jgi:spore coat polysaccharide biosynthesis protein SpsF
MAQKIGIVIQCRLNSLRLPGKVLLPLGKFTIVEHVYRNATKSKLASECIVAIPETKNNENLAQYLKNKSIPFIMGSEENLVSRHLTVAKQTNLDIIVRIPADNPLPHASEIDRIIHHHTSENIAGFSSNLQQVYNSGYPDGIGAEVFSFEILNQINQKESLKSELEHLHLNFFDYSSQTPKSSSIKVSTVFCPKNFARPDIRLDVNTLEDYQYFSDMFDYFGDSDFDICDIIKWNDLSDLSKYKK